MKTLLHSLIISTLFLLPLSITSYADVYNQIPEDTAFTIKLDPSGLNKTLQSYYNIGATLAVKSLIESQPSIKKEECVTTENNIVTTKDNIIKKNPLENETITFLIKYVTENPTYISTKLFKNDNEVTDGYAAFFIEINKNEYNNKVLPYLKTLDTETELNETKIYKTSDSHITYLNEYLIIGSDEKYINELIEFENCTSNCQNSLGEKSKFKNIEKEFLSNSAVDIYVTDVSTLIKEFMEYYDPLMLNKSYIEAIKELGISIKEKSNTFTLATHIETDSKKIKALRYNFTNTKNPTLYKKLPSGNTLFFQNTTTAKSTIGAIQAMEEYEDAVSEVTNEFDINLDEILNALDNEMAFAIQDTGELLPSATFLAELNSNESNIKELIEQASNRFWTELSNEAKWIKENTVTANKIIIRDDSNMNFTITKKEIVINETSLDQFEFSFEFKKSENPYAPKFSKSDLTFAITIGITDKNFIFSTNKNIENEYGKGADLSENIKNKIKNNIDTISSIDIKNIETYFKNVFEKLKKIMPSQSENFTDASWSINTIAEALGEIYATSKSTNSYTNSTISMYFDSKTFMGNLSSGAYDALFENTSDIFKIISNANTDFTDVKAGEWYTNDVYYLTTHGIINGYEDKTFKPENQVTRAEFITLLIRTLQTKGVINSNYWYWGRATDYFTDIDEYSWYNESISQALEVEIINSNNSIFRPEEAITRAEAAQMLANAIDSLEIGGPTTSIANFYDVNESNQYANAVSTVNLNGIMTGKSTNHFAPFDKLTRAESAKILRTLIENIEQY